MPNIFDVQRTPGGVTIRRTPPPVIKPEQAIELAGWLIALARSQTSVDVLEAIDRVAVEAKGQRVMLTNEERARFGACETCQVKDGVPCVDTQEGSRSWRKFKAHLSRMRRAPYSIQEGAAV